MPHHQIIPILSARVPFEIDIAGAIPPGNNQVIAVVGTGKYDQLDQITRPVRERGHLQMSQDVASSSLIPNLLKTPNEGTVGALIMTKCILPTASTSKPPGFNPGDHGRIAHASSTHITKFPSCHPQDAQRQNDSRRDEDRNALCIGPQGRGWVPTVDRVTQVGRTTTQAVQTNESMRRHLPHYQKENNLEGVASGRISKEEKWRSERRMLCDRNKIHRRVTPGDVYQNSPKKGNLGSTTMWLNNMNTMLSLIAPILHQCR